MELRQTEVRDVLRALMPGLLGDADDEAHLTITEIPRPGKPRGGCNVYFIDTKHSAYVLKHYPHSTEHCERERLAMTEYLPDIGLNIPQMVAAHVGDAQSSILYKRVCGQPMDRLDFGEKLRHLPAILVHMARFSKVRFDRFGEYHGDDKLSPNTDDFLGYVTTWAEHWLGVIGTHRHRDCPMKTLETIVSRGTPEDARRGGDAGLHP